MVKHDQPSFNGLSLLNLINHRSQSLAHSVVSHCCSHVKVPITAFRVERYMVVPRDTIGPCVDLEDVQDIALDLDDLL